MADDDRQQSLIVPDCTNPNANSLHAPKDVSGFTDIYFEAKDGIGPWIVPQATGQYVHLISIQDHQATTDHGKGEMGNTIYTLTPDNLYVYLSVACLHKLM